MSKTFKIVGILAIVSLVGASVALVALYEASRQVPEFYRLAVDRGESEQRDARDQFVAQATALAGDLNHAGRWQTLFSADQINAWFALELKTNFPELLPGDLLEPRISIQQHEATVACRYQRGDVSAVLSLTIDVYLTESNVLALRIRRARAGALPVPLAQVLDGISHAARQLNLHLEWRKTHGDPVALITFAKPRTGKSDRLTIETIELRDGELYVAGCVGPGETAHVAHEAPSSDDVRAADGDHPLVGEVSKHTRQE
jgi:hypothetical protein